MFNKRYQVLLSDWMEEYFKSMAQKYDQNLSTTLRSYLCLGIIRNVSMLYPEFKTELDSKEFLASSNRIRTKDAADSEIYSMMSKVLFEARKAVEFRLAKEKKKKSK